MSLLSARLGAVVAVLMSTTIHGIFAQGSQPDRGAPPVVRINADGTVSIKADAVPVRHLLEALQPACPMELRFDPRSDAGAESSKLGARAVSIALSGIEAATAVAEVLKASGLDFAMHTSCGTQSQPTLVVVRESGGAPIVFPARATDPDNPWVKAKELPPLPAGPPPEPEQRQAPGAHGGRTVVMQGQRQALPPGEITAAQLAERLAPRPAKSRMVTLPFPDANGNLVEVPIRNGRRPQTAGFPVFRPDAPADADKATPPAPKNPADARRPGGGGSHP